MGLTFILLAVAVATVECVDREKLGSTPPPQKKFNEDKYMGDWYIQARLPPCSWSGSSGFNNYVSQYSKQQSGSVHLKDTWRSSDCTSATLKHIPRDLAGAYLSKDPIGDVLSGDAVIVATDYKKFAIKWGCTKVAVGGTCSDPYVVVKTRKRDPSPHTWKAIEAILDHYWKLSLSEMIRVSHDKHACVQFKEQSHYHVPHGVHHLKKTY